MNHNGTLAIIFIYSYLIMTSLPLLFRDGGKRSCQFMVYGTFASAPAPAPGSQVNLYSRFKERLDATSNLAESEYDVRTSDALASIYNLTGDILSQQLKQAQTEADSRNGNYADKLLNGGKTLSDGFQGKNPFRAVASSSNTNTEATADTGNAADAFVGKKNVQLINTPVSVSNADQSDHRRQAHKIQKASRILRHSPFRSKNSHPPTTITEKRQSSRPSLVLPDALFSLTKDAGLGKLSTSKERPYAMLEQQQRAAKNIDDCTELRKRNTTSRSPLDVGSEQTMNGFAMESLDASYGNGDYIGDDDSTKPFGFSGIKWRKKLQIDGNKNNLRKSRFWPNGSREEKSNGLIQSDDEDLVDEEKKKDEEVKMPQQQNVGDYFLHDDGTRHIGIRSTDSFPEVFSHPLVESNSAPTTTTTTNGNGLNEAIKNANSLLSSVQGVAGKSQTSIVDLEDSSHRIGKQIQTLNEATLNGPNVASGTSAANLTNVMEKVLDELESIKECKAVDGTPPEGSPCDISGSWNSETIGLQFHISIANPSPLSRTFIEGKEIDIELTERVPPRRHNLMECDWFLTGNIVKQIGGPFYMTAQKADRFTVATFAGLCKICGGIPTIFGSWTFVYPAKDCQDISLAVENKRDILRRDTLEAKRKHRRDRIRSKDKSKCSHCLL